MPESPLTNGFPLSPLPCPPACSRSSRSGIARRRTTWPSTPPPVHPPPRTPRRTAVVVGAPRRPPTRAMSWTRSDASLSATVDGRTTIVRETGGGRRMDKDVARAASSSGGSTRTRLPTTPIRTPCKLTVPRTPPTGRQIVRLPFPYPRYPLPPGRHRCPCPRRPSQCSTRWRGRTPRSVRFPSRHCPRGRTPVDPV